MFEWLCIGEEYWLSGDHSLICPNLPSPPALDESLRDCTFDPSLGCEDRSCPPDKPFSCGDGECVKDFLKCRNGRHNLLLESMGAQGNLSYDCWMTMICFTKIVAEIDLEECKHFDISSNRYRYPIL